MLSHYTIYYISYISNLNVLAILNTFMLNESIKMYKKRYRKHYLLCEHSFQIIFSIQQNKIKKIYKNSYKICLLSWKDFVIFNSYRMHIHVQFFFFWHKFSKQFLFAYFLFEMKMLISNVIFNDMWVCSKVRGITLCFPY